MVHEVWAHVKEILEVGTISTLVKAHGVMQSHISVQEREVSTFAVTFVS